LIALFSLLRSFKAFHKAKKRKETFCMYFALLFFFQRACLASFAMRDASRKSLERLGKSQNGISAPK